MYLQVFPAVLRALKSKVARLALVKEFAYHIQGNRAQLEHQQFDMVVRLLNCALQVSVFLLLFFIYFFFYLFFFLTCYSRYFMIWHSGDVVIRAEPAQLF